MKPSFVSTIAVVASIGQVAALPSYRARDTSSPQIGYIDVAVATVWTNQSKPRPIDAPALTNPVQIEQWLDSMNVSQFLDLTNSDRTQTQGLYGTQVELLDYADGWYHVAVAGQPTPKNTFGYPGWVPAAQISLDESFGVLQAQMPFALVNKVATTMLYRDEALSSPYVEISYDTRLPVLSQANNVIQVALPSGGSAYVSTTAATVFNSVSDIPYPTGTDLVSTAELFLNQPYLWGGTSAYGFDCSGYTHTIYDGHGITIPRDSDAQADFTGHGYNVSQSDLQAGDLIYYAYNPSDASTIHHVAMYVGNGNMAEAYGAGIPVRIAPVRFNNEYWGAQRFLKN